MSVVMSHTLSDIETPQSPRITPFLVAALLIHLALFFTGLLYGGIYGVPGPGGGDALTFQLAAGDAHDRFAAPLTEAVKPKPAVEKPKVKPKPKPKPKIEAAPRKKKDEAPRPVEDVKEEPEQQLTLEEELAGMGVAGGKGRGARGDAPETILNKRGNSLTGSMVQSQMTGHTLFLNLLSREDYQGANGAIDSEVKLNADGTADVSVTHRFFQTYHEQYSSTRSEKAGGHWWVDGDRLCLQTQALADNTKNCYDLSAEGPMLHFYYAPCTSESSMLCKAGRKAGTGRIE